jgi:hypothetical protein
MNRMENIISRIQRELPDTDKDRYDAAYERGRAQARSGNVFGGLAFGALVGAVLMYLFDPERGTDRRNELLSWVTGLRDDLATKASGTVEDIQDRPKDAARDVASEVGSAKPNGGTPMHRGNGTPVAGLPVDDAPGASVPDPLQPEEIMQYGASGPIAGATLASAPLSDQGDQEAWEAAEREAKRASESQAGS